MSCNGVSSNGMSSNGVSDLPVSDVHLQLAAFRPEQVSAATQLLNNQLIEKCKTDVKWWTCGAEEYRRRRAAGETAFPPAPTLSRAGELVVPSRKASRNIRCRYFTPPVSKDKWKGVMVHIHGGGFVIGSAAGQDLLLDELANQTQLFVVSVDYRLAPEHPYPAANQDCHDVAEWLVDNAPSKWACEVKFVCGESAGATLSTSVLSHLREIGKISKIEGAVLSYGCFDLSFTPSMRSLDPEKPLILSYEDASRFLDEYLPGMSMEERRGAQISPLYYNSLANLCSALFIVGTEDGLTDDTILMSAKWQLAGNEAIVKFVSGAGHGFMTFDGRKVDVTRQGWDTMIQYLNSRMPK